MKKLLIIVFISAFALTSCAKEQENSNNTYFSTFFAKIDSTFVKIDSIMKNEASKGAAIHEETQPDSASIQKREGGGTSIWDSLFSIATYTVPLIALLAGGFLLARMKKSKKKNKPATPTIPTTSTTPAPASAQKPAPTSAQKPAPTSAQKPAPAPKRPTSDPLASFGQFALQTNNWAILGASVIGNGHVSMSLPCQDHCGYLQLENNWGIAVSSDGAGSAKHSDKGSQITVHRALYHFKQLIGEEGWMSQNELPSELKWNCLAHRTLKKVHDDIQNFAEHENIAIKDLNATIIVVIHTPQGLLTCHVGDGRAGYKDNQGNWKSIMTPHKGEEANQTIFIPSDFWGIPYYEMSGVLVPEARVIKGKITAFALMSDGCEHTTWLCNQFDSEKNMFFDPNIPHQPFFENVIRAISKFKEEGLPDDEIIRHWTEFLREGNEKFKKETDDKTLIVGTIQ